jgi:hypothetical protein
MDEIERQFEGRLNPFSDRKPRRARPA